MNTEGPANIGRNDPCHCGSGKKYKKCCAAKDEALRREALDKQWSEAVEKKKHEDHQAAQQHGAKAPPARQPAKAPLISRSGPQKFQSFSRIPRKSGES